MKLPIKLALLLAIPVEAINFRFFAFPIDVELPDSATWWQNLIGFQWVILHLPGMRLSNLINKTDFAGHDRLLIFTSGYIDTAILLFAAILTFRLLRQRDRKSSVAPTDPLTTP